MRKSKPKKRILLPDPKFHDTLVTRFVNNLMYGGNKSTAYGIFYDALTRVEEKTKESGLDIWKKAMTNVMPTVEVKSRRVGGATFQIPSEIRPDRRVAGGLHRRPGILPVPQSSQAGSAPIQGPGPHRRSPRGSGGRLAP